MVTIVRRTRESFSRLPRPLRIVPALAAVLVIGVVAVAVAGGGGGIPDDAVATVDGEAIDESAFDHWLTVAASAGGRPAAQTPKPPDFAACVAERKKVKTPKGQTKPTDAQLEDQCEQEYVDLRNRAMQLLITQRWIEGEAKDLGVSASDAEVRKAFDEQRKRSFPKDADYRKWLEQSGQTEEDIRLRVRLDLLQSKIRDRMAKGDDRVTAGQVEDYYERNKERFGEPRRRDVQLVLAETRARAERAMAALRNGRPWRDVVKQYSIDPATKQQAGKLSVAEGEQENRLDEALFEARLRELSGPVETAFGWYVFQVLKSKRGSSQTLAQAKPTVEQLVLAERRQQRLSNFTEEFRAKWRARTECRPEYRMADCANAPAATPTPAPRSSG
jgi:foldase protein PrsA